VWLVQLESQHVQLEFTQRENCFLKFDMLSQLPSILFWVQRHGEDS
jgi:hypothetical protein